MTGTSPPSWLFLPRGGKTNSDSLFTSALYAAADDVLGFLVTLALTIAYLSRGRLWDKKDPLHHLWFEKPQANLVDTGPQSKNRNIAKKLEDSKSDIVIFWGSQSGTAERLAVRLSRELRSRFNAEAIVADLSDYDASSIAWISPSKVAVFIISTYGEGDPPDNTNDFWSWLVTRNDAPDLRNLRYAAFGLGNSNYNAYNRVIDIIAKSFDTLGAQSLLLVGKGDDAKGSTVEDFLSWQEALFGIMKTALNYQEQEFVYVPVLSTTCDASIEAADLHHGVPIAPLHVKKGELERSKIHALPLTEARELFSNSERSCLHLEFDIAQFPQLKYKTGDHLAVWPQNPTEEVECLLTVLGLQSQREIPISISVVEAGDKSKLPTPTTLNALFGHYLDICGPISRDLFSTLVQFAPSESSKRLLIRLSSDGAVCSEFLGRKYMNIGRLLTDLVEDGTCWTSIPLSFLLEYLPHTKPRYYSISSSSVVQPQQIAITALVSNTPIKGDIHNHIPGLTTNYMERLKLQLETPEPETQSPLPLTILPPRHLYAHIQRSRFKLPLNATTPLILIASGTGIAPFRAFLAERTRLHRMKIPIGRCMLFYGARSCSGEFLYADEMAKTLDEQGAALVEIVTAFSRDPLEAQDSPATGKWYVQDRVREHFGDVAKLLLEENAWIYVCGSAGMGHGVARVMDQCFGRDMGWANTQYREWAAQMKRTRKWQEDVWG